MTSYSCLKACLSSVVRQAGLLANWKKSAVMSQWPRGLREGSKVIGLSSPGLLQISCWEMLDSETFLGLFSDQEIIGITLEDRFFNQTSGVPLCNYKHQWITWRDKTHPNLLFSNSPRKTSLKYRGAFLLEAAVHSSHLAGLSLAIKLFATRCSVALQRLCQTRAAQWGNPSCQAGKPGLRRRKWDLKRKDVKWWATALGPALQCVLQVKF